MKNIYFERYNSCTFCGSKSLKLEKKQVFENNFYTKAIINDLDLDESILKTIKTYECQKCFILQNNPWFNKKIARKIYSNIYGQHNRSWSNVINFFKKKTFPNHGNLFELLTSKINIKKYAEFNSPFMGIFLNFFAKEHKYLKNQFEDIFTPMINYLSSRQLAGHSMTNQLKSEKSTQKYLKKIQKFKIKNSKIKKVKKFLLTDNSPIFWAQNDNYKSVNSRSLAMELFDLDIIDFKQSNEKFDLFGIFHTLDHTFQPKDILNFAIRNSEFVIIYCHVNKNLSKQHQFSLTENFLTYLQKKGIYTIKLNNMINKKFKSPELYFLCSKQKNKIKKLNNSYDSIHNNY